MKQDIKIDFDERCYPDLSPKRVKDDHLFRYNFFRQFVSGKVVLDIASGEGYGSQILKTAGAKKVYGLDNDSSVVTAAALKYPGIEFLAGEATKTQFENDFFDLIISFETWHHLDNYENFIPELWRIMKPGGTLILSVPNSKVVYAASPGKEFFTKFYRFNFDKKAIEKYFDGYFKIESWYGQRFVKRIYLNPLFKFLLKIMKVMRIDICGRVDRGLRTGSGPKVGKLESDNARYLIVIAKKQNKK